MARCAECKKYVGCGCNLNNDKLCSECEQKALAKAQEMQNNKISIQINLPKNADSRY